MSTATGDAPAAAPIPLLEVSEEAARVAASLTSNARDRVYLSNGVVLKVKPVPPLAIREAATSVPQPRPPIVHITAQDRDEENPNDPDYLAALSRWQDSQLMRVADVMIIFGTEIDTLPEDGSVVPPESDDWVEMLDALGISINRENRYARYLAWIRLYACRLEADIAEIFAAIVPLSGVTELEVQRAAAAFLYPAR